MRVAVGIIASLPRGLFPGASSPGACVPGHRARADVVWSAVGKWRRRRSLHIPWQYTRLANRATEQPFSRSNCPGLGVSEISDQTREVLTRLRKHPTQLPTPAHADCTVMADACRGGERGAAMPASLLYILQLRKRRKGTTTATKLAGAPHRQLNINNLYSNFSNRAWIWE